MPKTFAAGAREPSKAEARASKGGFWAAGKFCDLLNLFYFLLNIIVIMFIASCGGSERSNLGSSEGQAIVLAVTLGVASI